MSDSDFYTGRHIRDVFARALTPEHYANLQKQFSADALTPLNNDFASESQRLKASFAARGLTGSSLETNALAAMNDLLTSGQSQIDGQFTDWQKGQQQNANQAQRQLLNQSHHNGADWAKLIDQTNSKANNFSGQSAKYSPIGDIFASLVNPLTNAGSPTAQPTPLGNPIAPSELNIAGAPRRKQNALSVAGTGAPSSTVIG